MSLPFSYSVQSICVGLITWAEPQRRQTIEENLEKYMGHKALITAGERVGAKSYSLAFRVRVTGKLRLPESEWRKSQESGSPFWKNPE